LSQIVTEPGPVTGRKVAVIADAGSDLAGIAALTKALARQGVTALVTAAAGGTLKSGRRSLVVERTFATTRSIEFDAAIIASGTSATDDIKLVVMLQELFRHCKPLGAWGDGAAMLEAAGIDRTAAGVLVGDAPDKAFSSDLVAALGLHRVWERAGAVMASAVAPSKTAPKKTASTRRVGE
jgi:catalase